MKTVIEMAREAGYMKTVQGGAEVSMASMDCLERFAELVRADEREACAQVAERCFEGAGKHKLIIMAVEAAKAIRARGNT